MKSFLVLSGLVVGAGFIAYVGLIGDHNSIYSYPLERLGIIEVY